MFSESFFRPRSVVIIGASDSPGKIGSGLVEAMQTSGVELFLLNPKHDRLFGFPCYPSLAELPRKPSHAFIAVRRDFVLPYLRDCAALGIPNAVVISSGFKEKDAIGAELELQIEAISRESGMTILGPNTLGFINTSVSFNGSFLPAQIAVGPVSVISQSGGVGMALLSALTDQRCGLAKWVCIGNEAGVSALDALEYLALDAETKAIAVCFEGLRELGRFLRRAAEVNLQKPIVLLRDGKSSVGLRAAASHTGAMVYAGSVIPSLIRQVGLLEASSVRDCAVMLKALCIAAPAAGNRAVLLTNTAGPSVLAADVMEASGVSLPSVPETLSRRIDDLAGVPMELKNPADISSNGLSPINYGIAARELLCSSCYDLLLAFFSLNPHLRLPEEELIEAVRLSGKPAVACFLSSQSVFSDYPLTTEAAGIPCFCDPHDAAVACSAILRRGEMVRKTSTALPELPHERLNEIRAYLDQLGEGRTLLTERESKGLLSVAGVAVDVPVLIERPEDAITAADHVRFPVAVKLESSLITHKSAVGGVRLHISSPQELSAAANEMFPRLRALDPNAVLTVQPMGGEGFELILGLVRSPLGILLMAGQGGLYAEALQDNAFCLLPASREDLGDLLRSLRCSPVLYSSEKAPLFGEDALFSLIGILCSLMEKFPQIEELEINPCRMTKDGLCILDARAVLST